MSYLISISPTQNPWNKDFRERYKQQIESVTDRATGMILASDQLTTMTKVDGVKTSLLASLLLWQYLKLTLTLSILLLFPF